MMLPPVMWEVDNWLIGFADNHPLVMPCTLWSSERLRLPGTNSAMTHDLSFIVRLLENSPDSTPASGSRIDIEAGRAIIDALQKKLADGGRDV